MGGWLPAVLGATDTALGTNLGVGRGRRLNAPWNPNSKDALSGVAGSPVGGSIPMASDPTTTSLDSSGAGLGADSSAPPSLGKTPASTTTYEQSLANPPQRRGGLRGVLGTIVGAAGELSGVPTLSQAGNRIGWGPNENDPLKAKTPEEYQRNLERAGIISQIDQQRQQRDYIDVLKRDQLMRQQDVLRLQQQKDQERQQAIYEGVQKATEPLPQTPNVGVIAPTPTPSQIPTQLPTSSAGPIPSTAIGSSMPPAFDPGTGATKPVFNGAPFVTQPPTEAGKLLTQVDPITKQPQTRFEPSRDTLKARDLAAAAAQKEADMVTMAPGPAQWALENKLINSLDEKVTSADAKDIRDKYIASKSELSGKNLPPDTEMVDLNIGGKPHKVLVSKRDGSVIKDLGESGIKPPPADEGSWTLQEDAQGNPVYVNNKTLQTRAAPGVQKQGTAQKRTDALAKETEPVDTAINYANDYMRNKYFTAAGDEALMEKYFEVAKPSTGFRMTQVQTDMLNKGRSWLEGSKASIAHRLTPQAPYYSDTQRQQIVDTMNSLAKAKSAAIQKARGSGAGASQFESGGTEDDPAGVMQFLKNK